MSLPTEIICLIIDKLACLNDKMVVANALDAPESEDWLQYVMRTSTNWVPWITSSQGLRYYRCMCFDCQAEREKENGSLFGSSETETETTWQYE